MMRLFLLLALSHEIWGQNKEGFFFLSLGVSCHGSAGMLWLNCVMITDNDDASHANDTHTCSVPRVHHVKRPKLYSRP